MKEALRTVLYDVDPPAIKSSGDSTDIWPKINFKTLRSDFVGNIIFTVRNSMMSFKCFHLRVFQFSEKRITSEGHGAAEKENGSKKQR